MKEYKIILSLWLMVLGALQVNGQSTSQDGLTAESVILTRSYEDSIILRWAVNNAKVWTVANQNGYQISKAEVLNENSNIKSLSYAPIAGSPFLPWKKNKLKKYISKNEKSLDSNDLDMLELVYELLYNSEGDKDDASGLFDQDLTSLKEGKNKKDLPFGFSMLAAERSAIAAHALGLRFTDKDVETGKSYAYKITVSNSGSIYTILDGYTKAKAEKFDPSNYTRKVNHADRENRVLINWEDIDDCGSYNILISTNGTDFTKVNNAPIVNSKDKNYKGVKSVTYLSNDLINYTKYYYQVWGLTAFGDKVLIGECEGMPRDLTPPQKPYLEQPKHLKPDEVLIKWTITPPLASDFAGYRIGRGSHVEGPFEEVHPGLLAQDQSQFIDKNFNKEGRNYYVLEAIDTAGNKSISRVAYLTLVDSIPPSIPVYIKATIDTSGAVKLLLEPNKEKDFMGYRILKSNGHDHEYSVIYESFGYENDSIAKSTTIYDTLALNTNTKNAYYTATALDYHFNESEKSEPIKVTRPDTVPPVSPLFKDYLSSKEAIELIIIPSTSKDLSNMTLYRNTDGGRFENYAILDKNDSNYIDKNVEVGKRYGYMLVALDLDGNSSKTKYAQYAQVVPDFTLPEVVFKVSLLEESKQVEITWEYDEDIKEDLTFMLFRKSTTQGWKMIKSVKKRSAYRVLDKIAEVEAGYMYKIKVITPSGKESIENKEQGLKGE
jgi:hypothetical protein